MDTPTVKNTPSFKVGEIIECRHTGERLKLLVITKDGYQCQGRAGIMPFDCAQKPLTPEQSAELAKP